MDRPVIREGALLLARLVVGIVVLAHGWDILFITGVAATANDLAALPVPSPTLTAWAVGSVQLVGGCLIIVGLLTTIVAGILAIGELAALYVTGQWAHLFLADGGMEYRLMVLTVLLLILVFGAGRASLDGVFAGD
ncbi:MAG: DoxX family protein [Corynebacterium sp.]|nr:DoxX family protein [Corynebacterium sp.]